MSELPALAACSCCSHNMCGLRKGRNWRWCPADRIKSARQGIQGPHRSTCLDGLPDPTMLCGQNAIIGEGGNGLSSPSQSRLVQRTSCCCGLQLRNPSAPLIATKHDELGSAEAWLAEILVGSLGACLPFLPVLPCLRVAPVAPTTAAAAATQPTTPLICRSKFTSLGIQTPLQSQAPAFRQACRGED
jgi:hypothetical protein